MFRVELVTSKFFAGIFDTLLATVDAAQQNLGQIISSRQYDNTHRGDLMQDAEIARRAWSLHGHIFCMYNFAATEAEAIGAL